LAGGIVPGLKPADGCIDQHTQGWDVCGNGLADENGHGSFYTVRVYPRLATVRTWKILIGLGKGTTGKAKPREPPYGPLAVRSAQGSFGCA
jgi:hypothetical protein